MPLTGYLCARDNRRIKKFVILQHCGFSKLLFIMIYRSAPIFQPSSYSIPASLLGMIAILGLVIVGSVQAQIAVRTETVTTNPDMRLPHPANAKQAVILKHSMTLHAGRDSYGAHHMTAPGKASGSREFVDIQYDQGEGVGARNGGNPLFAGIYHDEVKMSTRFAPKASPGDDREIQIDRIWLAPYFDSQFSNATAPPSAPRDLAVYIYSDEGGKPGEVLFSKVIEDPRSYAAVTDLTLNFFELDLSNEAIGVLPDVVHIAYGNTGDDENFLVIGPAPYTTENVSYIYFPENNAWEPLWNLVAGGDSFEGTVVPIRARFSLEGTASLSFAQVIGDQSFPQGQSIVPLVLPEATGGVSPINYSLTPALPTGLSFNSSTRTISGTPTEVTSGSVLYTYRATDSDGDTANLQFSIQVYASSGDVEFVEIRYDQGEAVGARNDGNHLFVSLSHDEHKMATRFAPKASTRDDRKMRIDRIWLAPYFDNQFSNATTTPSAPRDLAIYIYSDQGGEPGDALFSKVIEDPRPYAEITDFTLNFFELDLSSENIGVLPDVVHIAYGNTGDDENLLTIGPAPYTTENVSHLYLNGRWAQLWNVRAGENSFDGTVVPIRARFSLEGSKGPLSFAQAVGNQSFPQGQSIMPLVLPEATGGVSPINYSLTPALPTGLSFNSLTRTISGTPTEVTTGSLFYTYRATDSAGNTAGLQFDIRVYSPVATEQRLTLPESFAVHGNYPNPFRQSTRIVFDLPWPARATIEVMDVMGRHVLTVPSEDLAAGWQHNIELNGVTLPPGLYLYRVAVMSPEGNSVLGGRFVRIR